MANAIDIRGICHRYPWHLSLISVAYAAHELDSCAFECASQVCAIVCIKIIGCEIVKDSRKNVIMTTFAEE